MTTTLFAYPRNTAFGRVLPKGKIYERGTPSSATKEFFVRQVERITWEFKLAPETINLQGTSSVPEIQVFSVTLKNGELKTEVLRCIDQAIPFPILFELQFNGKVKPIAAFKRPSEADSTKWVISNYFEGNWVKELTTEDTKDTEKPVAGCSVVKRTPLPLVMDLGQLYERLLEPMMSYPARPGESLQTRVERMELIRIKQREMERCEARLRQEKQFNRKVEINAELRILQRELENMTRSLSNSGIAVTS